WEMAYGTGNDGARYLMMVDYLRSKPWEWFHIITDPTYYGLIAHTLDHEAGAMLMSLLGTSAAIADSLVAVAAAVLAAAAFCLLFETIFSPVGWVVRYVVALFAVALLGFWGTI